VQIPKLVVFDVDGTLVNWDGVVTPATTAALNRLRALRVPIALATGRPMALAPLTIDQAGGADWMVCGNGSVVFDVPTGELIRDRSLPNEVVVPLIQALRQRLPGVGFAVELLTTLLEEPGFARRVPEDRVAPPVDDVLAAYLAAPEPVRRVIPYHDDYDDRLDELASIVSEFLDDRCQIQFGGLAIVDVSPSGDHKAAALQVLIDHLGIEAVDVIAFGDGSNDIEMLQWAGTGVAMGNADPATKAAADVVTGDVDAGGVAEYLRPLLGLGAERGSTRK